MTGQSPQSPEARRRRQAQLHAQFGIEAPAPSNPVRHPIEIVKRVAIGVYNDGFLHAGNLAFIALLAIFPFIILATAVATLFGRNGDNASAILAILSSLPPNVAEVLSGPLFEVSDGRSGNLLWFGAAIGLWTAASFIETIRDILRRAYGVQHAAAFWHYRLASIGIIIAAVMLLLAAFSMSIALASIQHYLGNRMDVAPMFTQDLTSYRWIPALALFGTIYTIFLALTPVRYRRRKYRKWPGVLLITVWWLVTAELLPDAISLFGGYGRTYGSLAGVMVTLIFFYIVGFGVVIGAELNAALADAGDTALKGEHYEGPYSAELTVEDLGEDEEGSEEEKKQGISA